MIGIGLVVGPAVGLIGHLLARSGGSHQLGILAAALPLMLVCAVASLRSLWRGAAFSSG